MADLHPDLSEEDLLEGRVKITEPSATAGFDPGDVVDGLITGTGIQQTQYDGDDIYYFKFDIQLEDEFEAKNLASYPMNGGKISESTKLGTIIERFKGGLDEIRDEDVNLVEFFDGEEISFIYDRVPGNDGGAFSSVAEDEEGNPLLFPRGEIPDDVTPALKNAEDDFEPDESDDSGGRSDEEAEGKVIEIVADNEGQDKSEVMRKVAQEGGPLVKTFKQMIKDGTIEVDDENKVSL